MRFSKGNGFLATLLILIAGCAGTQEHPPAKGTEKRAARPRPKKAKPAKIDREASSKAQLLAGNLYKTALQAYLRKDLKRARRDVKACLDLWPLHKEALHLRIQILQSLGDESAVAEARMRLEESLARLKRQEAKRKVRALLAEAREARKNSWNKVARARVEHALLILRNTSWSSKTEPLELEREAKRALAVLPRKNDG